MSEKNKKNKNSKGEFPDNLDHLDKGWTEYDGYDGGLANIPESCDWCGREPANYNLQGDLTLCENCYDKITD